MAYRTTPSDPRPAAQLQRPPLPPIADAALQRYRGHVLVPEQTVDHLGRRPNPTAYVADQLLVQGSGSGAALEALVEAAKATGHVVGASPTAPGKRAAYVDQLSEAALAELADKVWVTRLRLRPDPDSSAPTPDAWTVLQKYRSMVGDERPDECTVGLNHLVSLTTTRVEGSPYFSGPGIPGAPYFSGPGTDGAPYFSGPGAGQPPYPGPGLGGRVPVTWLGRPPAPTTTTTGRRPVVAVLDTGLGEHDWLVPPHASLGAWVGGHPIGLADDVPDAELTGVVRDPLQGGLDRDAGHGTFIAGIVRQVCPDARVLAIRVMPSDGVVDEHQLTIALNMLLVRQARAQLGRTARDRRDRDEVVDVVSLSLGYYHESPDDVAYSSVLGGTLRRFGELGVAVVAAAGNDHTITPMFPAGLASRSGGADLHRDAVPLTSVGALNPSGTVALFSNAGDWVSCSRPGANVVSTLPVTFDGSLQPAIATPDGREAIDPDDYASGFGIWSGTSFAAPVLAGEIAAHLVGQGGLDDVSPEAMVSRGWAAVGAEVGWQRP